MELSRFSEIWVAVFKYQHPSGENYRPKLLQAEEIISGRTVFLDHTQLQRLQSPPIPGIGDGLIVTYDAPALLGCFLSLGWDLPYAILDLHAEFRCHASGLFPAGDWPLTQAAMFYGAEAIGGSVASQISLLDKMRPKLDLNSALQRGRYTRAVAYMESIGIPIDTNTWPCLKAKWRGLRQRLVEDVDRHYGVFDGTSFREGRWDRWVESKGIPWPRRDSGELVLDDATFKSMSLAYPDEVGPMWELRKTLNRLRIDRLAVGSDGRNRTSLRPFACKTGRNQPSTNGFVFGSAAWVRALIKPRPGKALAYLDYEQQEFGIAAALSSDPAMMKAYCSGDPYLAFAKQSGAVPPDATKETHAMERNLYKSCCLGIQYGMGWRKLAVRIRGTEDEARDLIRNHHKVYGQYWKWSKDMGREARAWGLMRSAFGWCLNVNEDTRHGTLRNFPLQATGADMLRLACCMLIESGIQVCALIHDAVLIEAPIDELDSAVATCQQIMAEASSIILGGFRLRSDAKKICFPDRYMDDRGREFWKKVYAMMGRTEVIA